MPAKKTSSSPERRSARQRLEQRYMARRSKLRKLIAPAAALLVSAPKKIESRDIYFPHRQDSDFFYFTGFDEPNSALLLRNSSTGPRSVLFLAESDLKSRHWDGETLGLRRARRRFTVDEVCDFATLAQRLPELLKDSAELHYPAGVNPEVDEIVWRHFRSTLGPRQSFPGALLDIRRLTAEFRLIKDREEIQTLRHVGELTARAFVEFFGQLSSVRSERHGAALLESLFCRLGADGPSFPTIVAAGNNATTLHHQPKFHPLWRKELVLIDAGASFRGYAADITRTIPVGGKFSKAQAAVYAVVHQALLEATAAAVPGATLDAVHQVAVRVLTKGLIELKALRGNVSQLLAGTDYKQFYMHQTSHWLGLDVHDISPVAGVNQHASRNRPLEPGMVLTIEPGLYFALHDHKAPKALRGIGIRLEDDILITKGGNEVLTAAVPSRMEDVEALIG